jgi:Asp-tRNA(Asn)/Glu-tRNA(Gln) amidotransferase A subunit family amidase
MNLDEYRAFDATELARLVVEKEVTPVELLTLARRRAADVNPALNAIVIDIDEADAQAADPGLSGPFAGVPFLIKDLAQDYQGYPTSCGSRSLSKLPVAEHAHVTRRFLDAGLVIFGKTNTPEFGAKGITEPTLFGPARNPWNPGHTPGGSSGGSGAAVAAGIVPAAGANDGGGSIRIPSACNGLVGLKPSRGLSPFGPARGEQTFGMSVQGVVARTVRDAAGLYDAIVGPTPSSVYPTPTPSTPFASQIATPPSKLRIGFSTESALAPSVHPEARAAVEHAAGILVDLGHIVEEVAPPYDDAALSRDFLTIWFAHLAAEVDSARRRTGAGDDDFEADTLAAAELGRSAGVVAAFNAFERVNHYVKSLSAFHDTYDYLLTPTLAKPPLQIGEIATPSLMRSASRIMAKVHGGSIVTRTGVIDGLVEQNLGWVPYTQVANLTGRPAINVPLYWTGAGSEASGPNVTGAGSEASGPSVTGAGSEASGPSVTGAGLPLGVQFVGGLGSDGGLLALAAQLEQAAPWAHRYTGVAV